MSLLQEKVHHAYLSYRDPYKRIALSIRYPFLKTPIMWIHRFVRLGKRYGNSSYKILSSKSLYPHIVKKHKSVLMRKLGSTDMQLQSNKKINLKIAIHHINGSIISPGKKRSFRQHIGLPTYQQGYKDGVLLYQGSVIRGVGGGICQLANMLYRLVLHSPLEVSEYYHHSYDVFPDSGRALPFGSGATVVYNYVDLEFSNPLDYAFQFEIWQDEEFLYGRLRSEKELQYSYKIVEEKHCFVYTGDGYFRYNELYRKQIDRKSGNIVNTIPICTNFSPVLYELTDEQKRNAVRS